MTDVKICGLTDAETVRFASAEGADYLGFNFIEASPRHITIGQADMLLPEAHFSRSVALVADAGDSLIDAIRFAGFSIIQLHGSETPERLAEIKARTDCDVWKAIGVSERSDLDAADAYEAADQLLIDAKPPKGATRKGGHGATFDWSVLKGWDAPKPWLLAGGLTPDNVATAIAATGAPGVDVASGVERERGVKDKDKIAAFIRAAKGTG